MVMEWGYVQVCDDFLSLCCYKCAKRTKALVIPNASQVSLASPMPSSLQCFKLHDNEVKLAYVVCTCAKQVLLIPSIMMVELLLLLAVIVAMLVPLVEEADIVMEEA